MDRLQQAKEMCRRLRFKGMYINVEPDPRIPNTSDGFCWCSHTQTCLGPDGEPVEKEDCTIGRGCFEAF